MFETAVGFATAGVRIGLMPVRSVGGRLADELLAGPMTERVIQALGEHRIVERIADELIEQGTLDVLADRLVDDERIELIVARVVESPGLERLLMRVLESRLVLEMTDRIIASEEMQHVIRHVANSPELRTAMAEQSAGVAQEMVSGVRTRTTAMDDAAERAVRGWLRRPRPRPA
jgi:hypothetical protein